MTNDEFQLDSAARMIQQPDDERAEQRIDAWADLRDQEFFRAARELHGPLSEALAQWRREAADQIADMLPSAAQDPQIARLANVQGDI
jgi:hypothetical protein